MSMVLQLDLVCLVHLVCLVVLVYLVNFLSSVLSILVRESAFVALTESKRDETDETGGI